MPPKGKDKGAAPVADTPAALRRGVTVRVDGILTDADLQDPYLTMRVPGTDQEFRTVPIAQCQNFEGDWVSEERGDGLPPVGLTITRIPQGTPAAGTTPPEADGTPPQPPSHVFEAFTKFGPCWRSTEALSLGTTCKGEFLRVIDSRRTNWEPCDITVQDTCHLTANGVSYVREGPHGHAFTAYLMEAEMFDVTAETITEAFGTQLQVQVMHKQTATAPPPEPPVADPKAKGKGKAPPAASATREVVYEPFCSTFISFIPLVMGRGTSSVLHAASGAGKARHALPGFASLKLTLSSVSDDGETPAPLLTSALEEQLMPLCVSFISLTDLPDSRPISIARSEGEKERPFLDTIATQRADYTALRRACPGVTLTCKVFPGHPPIVTPAVPHERSPGLHHCFLFLLGSIGPITNGEIPDMLQLIRHFATAALTVSILDRTPASPSGEPAAGAPFGFCKVQLGALLQQGGAGGAEDLSGEEQQQQVAPPGGGRWLPRRPIVKSVVQVLQHRASIEEEAAAGGASEDARPGTAATQQDAGPGRGGGTSTSASASSPTASGTARFDPGQYMSWGTTLTLKFEMARPLPEISYHSSAVRFEAGVAAAAAAAAAAACAGVAAPEGAEGAAGDAPHATQQQAPATPEEGVGGGGGGGGGVEAPPAAGEAGQVVFDKDSFRRFLSHPKAAAAAATYQTLGVTRSDALEAASVRGAVCVARPIHHFSRLVIVMKYAARSTRAALHAVMRCIYQMDKATDDDDVVLFAPRPTTATPDEPAEAAPKKGAAGGKGGAKPATPSSEEPAAASAGDGGGGGAAGGASEPIQVHTDPSRVSGIEVIDGVNRIIILEGVTTTVLSSILDALHGAVSGEDLLNGTVSVAFNPTLPFPMRHYIRWPPLVPNAPPARQDGEAASIDAGGVRGRIRRIRLSQPLSAISKTLPNYVKRRVSEGVLQAVVRLVNLTDLRSMQDAVAFSAFPTALQVVLLERCYGTTLNSYDVCGSESFLPFTLDFSESAEHREKAARLQQQALKDEAQYPFLKRVDYKQQLAASKARFAESQAGGAPASETQGNSSSNPPASGDVGHKQTLSEYLEALESQQAVPTSVASLRDYVGKEVVLRGIPPPPPPPPRRVKDGTAATSATGGGSGTSPPAKPAGGRGKSGVGVTFGTVTTGGGAGPEARTVLAELRAPALGGSVTLVLTDIPRPVKSITIEVEGKIIETGLCESGVAVQVYAWREVVESGMKGTARNIAFLSRKRAAASRLGYSSFHEVQRERLRRTAAETHRRARRNEMEAAGDSSGSDAELDAEVEVPIPLPEVATNYPFLNKQVVGGAAAAGRRARQPAAGGTTTGFSQGHVSAGQAVVASPGKGDQQHSAAFTQLAGGWRPLSSDDLDHINLPVRRRRDGKPGVLRSAKGEVCQVVFKGESAAQAVALGRLEVFSKCSTLDNRHDKKPLPQRIQDLQTPWAVRGNPFERAKGDGFKPAKGDPHGMFSGSLAPDPEPPLGVTLMEERVREKEVWESRVVVDDTVFHVVHRSHAHPIDKAKGILQSAPKKKVLRDLSPPPAPLSIQKPSQLQRQRPEVSTVYYAGKSQTWHTIENKDKSPIKPLQPSERVGPRW